MHRLERVLDVTVDRTTAWNHLARVEHWPGWARHIRSIQLDPPGELGPETRGTIRLTNGVRSMFRMLTLSPPDRWLWTGGFLWLRVDYDHVFEELGPERTRIRFLVDISGFASGSLGRLFTAIYAKNLDRAIPNLIAELEASGDDRA